MKPTILLGQAVAPDGTVLTLHRHDTTWILRTNGEELMSTRRVHSEEQFAVLGCATIAGRPRARVLVGGLGFGFTLKSALRLLGPAAQVVVAELMPEVVAWNRNPEWPLAGAALDDPRVELRVQDVLQVLRDSPASFDAVLLDIDNGVEPLSARQNVALYRDTGIRTAIAALRPGGRLSYWTAGEEPVFVKAMERAGLAVEVHRVRAHATTGPWHYVFTGDRLADRRPR